jgi:hypothetical protein
MNSTERVERIRARVRKPARIAALVTTFCAVISISVAAGQVSETRIGRFGSIGRDLSELEIAQITDLASAVGKAPWLILGFRSMIPGVATLRVYLEPDVTTERLNRGRILHLIADDAPRVAPRSRWKVANTESYGYVPLDGRRREFANEDDLGWPFAVRGEIDDETLISLVGFVRSRPPIPGVPEGAAPREVVSWPLSVIAQQDDQFIAALRNGGAEVFRVTVIKKGGRWMVAKWDWAIV